tara:strand:+ start:588 stop:794 length:207 start_codon:yes stop_codon:yes gene_type:complete
MLIAYLGAQEKRLPQSVKLVVKVVTPIYVRRLTSPEGDTRGEKDRKKERDPRKKHGLYPVRSSLHPHP